MPPYPAVLEVAPALDLSPPKPHEWLGLDVVWFQQLVDARNAYERGKAEPKQEAALSAETKRRTQELHDRLRGVGIVG
jgi:hypothetical protein